MRFKIFITLIVCCISAKGYSQKYNAEKIYKKTNEAVVKIFTYHDDNTRHGQGSGVIIKDRGWIVTNHHLVGDASILFAEHNGKQIQLDSIIAIDAKKDILILKFRFHDETSVRQKIPSIKIRESKSLKVGQKVFAIGSPYGFENTITEGIISGLRTAFDNSQSYIQISAPISPGSSGGAILNEKGELIGISTMVIDDKAAQNLNFAILIDDVLAAGDQRVGKNLIVEESRNLSYFYKKGYSEFLSRKYKSAISNYHEALKISSNQERGQLYYMLGLAFQKFGNSDSAIFYLQQAAQTYKIPQAYISLANVYFEKNELDKAEINYKIGKNSSPNTEEAYIGLGKIGLLKKDYPMAILNFKQVLDINPNNSQALFYSGLLASLVERFDDAIFFLNRAISINPKYAEAHLVLSDVFISIGQMTKAAEHQQKAYQLNPALRNRKK